MATRIFWTLRTCIFWCFFTLLTTITCDGVKYSSKYKDSDLLNILPFEQESSDNFTTNANPPWPLKIFNCVEDLGVEKCLKIFLLSRMDHVQNAIDHQNNVSIDFDVLSEVKKQFKWEEYKKTADSDINSQMLNKARGIFQNKKTKLVLNPGINIEVFPDKNGSINLNIKNDPGILSRGMKFPKKAFYRLIPMLLIPPLIMSAILPFVLPAMKIMILWVGMLNQMALMGAVFTLMRNNAFQEPTHEKRIIYVNQGYKNEKRPPPIVHHDSFEHSLKHSHDHEFSNPPITHFKGYPRFTTPGYDGDFDEDEDEHQFGGHGFDEDEYDRKGPRYRNNVKYGGKKGSYHNG